MPVTVFERNGGSAASCATSSPPSIPTSASGRRAHAPGARFDSAEVGSAEPLTGLHRRHPRDRRGSREAPARIRQGDERH
ncbi:MAG: hypothetical protein ACLVL7_11645 [Anaerotruncus massiliensis (ex Togo et al. 2019)]